MSRNELNAERYIAVLGWGLKPHTVKDSTTGETVYTHGHYGTCVDEAARRNKEQSCSG